MRIFGYQRTYGLLKAQALNPTYENYDEQSELQQELKHKFL